MQSIIDRPLDTIQELFAKNWKKSQSAEQDDFGVPEHFKELFDTREKLLQIPLLDAHSVDTLPLNSLVRFRCMVQDTELSQEVALFISNVTEEPNGEESLVCHRYSDGPTEDQINRIVPVQDVIDLRNCYYCISIPGESQWVKDHGKSLDSALQDMKLEGSTSSKVIQERYPFPGAQHFAAVVKTHSGDTSIGVTDMVEVIGVLGASDRVVAGDAFDFPDESADTPSVPTVHAILMQKVEDHGHPELGLTGVPQESDVQHYVAHAKRIKQELLQYISTAVRGDTLAAELVLLHFLSRVYSRPSGAAIGKLSLNLRDSSANSPVFSSLSRVMNSVLPKVHGMPMTLQTLNDYFFFPRGDEQLLSGVLQVTKGTNLILDESVMEEGTLVEKGVKNLQAVTDVSLYQTLNYVFPYNNLEFQTDISLLIVSFGKSLVPVDCAITLQPGEIHDGLEPSEEQLQEFRKYISVLRLADYKLPEEIAKEIETEFMEQRKAASAAGTALPSAEELAFSILLARLVSLSQGELTLSKESWNRAVALTKEVKNRGKPHQQ